MAEFASKGVGNAALTTGIIGTAGWALNGGLGNLFGNGHCCATGDDRPVNRYEAAQSARIAELETQVQLRDSNTYTDRKLLELYQYVDGRMRGIEGQICQQAVVNAQVTANISCMQNEIAVLNGLTKTVIPIDSICPEAMARYNSWVAPTT